MTDPDPRWEAVAAGLTWAQPPSALYTPAGWFPGGMLNLAVNCVDRHLADQADTPAVHWEGEPGDQRTLTYAELHREVVALAGALRGLGVRPGDRVALHLGWLPETVVAMLACARIGAAFAVLPVPLPAEALAERLAELAPRVLFTQDGAWRHGTIIPTKARADEALTAAGGIEHTVVVRRTGLDVAWFEGDRWLADLLGQDLSDEDGVPAFPADHPLLLASLANRRGSPVTVQHGTATLLAAAAAVHRHGVSPGGVFWCAGDISWLGAQAHGVLGPLAWGDTTVMFEGTLDVPNHRRLWDVVERYAVSVLLTTPSVLARVRGWADAEPPALVRRTLRRVVVMAEPLDPAVRAWITERLAADVGDAWGQIELGGIATVDRPADPGALPGLGLSIVDDSGVPVPDGIPGELVLHRPWAGMARVVEGTGEFDHWGRHPGRYATGDRAVRHDGALEFLGRIDPVISVSGQLVSLAEIRDALLEHPFVAAAEVVTQTDPRLGRVPVACVVPVPGAEPGPQLAAEIVETVREMLGGLARPRGLLFLDRLGDELNPEARRRALEALAAAVGTQPGHATWAQVLNQ